MQDTQQEVVWWQSRTIVAGVLSTIVGFLGMFGVVLPPGVDVSSLTDLALAVFGVAVIIFRLTQKPKTPQPDPDQVDSQ